MSARERGKMAKRRAKWQPAVVREKGKGTRSQDGENWGLIFLQRVGRDTN